MALSGHTACNADDKGRLQLFQLLHASHYAENPVLGIFPDSAGIEDYHICFVFILGKGTSHKTEKSLYFFAV